MQDKPEPFKMKFMDGTPVDDEYAKMISDLVRDACRAEEEGLVEDLGKEKR